jgi:hypothetical protein
MIRLSRLAACVVALGAASVASTTFAECAYPKAPTSYPDGRTATLEQMIAGQKTVKQFNADMDVYLKCVDEENPPPAEGANLTDADKKAIAAREVLRVKKHNAAVEAEEKVAEQFNTQLKIYKQAQANK